jgi:regulator of protease activity HflC (stomatin/prohibitin superfamily)
MDDRQTTLFTQGRSADFQPVVVQGAIDWRVANAELLAGRVDFSIDLSSGQWSKEPLARIDGILAGIAIQAVLNQLATRDVRPLLDEGVEPVRLGIAKALTAANLDTEIGISVADVRVTSVAPSSELERALQTPTVEALQQKADEATYARRALAVDKERAIAENELANRTELARREAELIEREGLNARARAAAEAEAQEVAATSEAEAIRVVEGAKAETERARIDIYRDIPVHVLMGLAAREFAGQAGSIEHLTITPELGQAIAAALRQPVAN